MRSRKRDRVCTCCFWPGTLPGRSSRTCTFGVLAVETWSFTMFPRCPVMPLTLISHFWNEEFLLPYWLRHHLPLFDHGVLIDYTSTDRSVEIIHELAPHWEV